MTGYLHTRIRHATDEKSSIFYPVTIVGAGPSGLAVACRLKSKLGFDQFRIFDRNTGIGGTWWSNRYPGVACDVSAVSPQTLRLRSLCYPMLTYVNRPTFFYSFSFAPNYTSESIFPSGPDYLQYLEGVIEQFGLLDKIQLSSEVRDVQWVEEDQEWELQIYHLPPETDHPCRGDYQRLDDAVLLETVRSKVVISATGILSKPKEMPQDVTGSDSFKGQILHAAAWPRDTNLDGKDVVLVGAGCSAAQIAPALLRTKVKSLTQIIRSPPWIEPRIKEPGGRERYAKWAPRIYGNIPLLGLSVRLLVCWMSELLWYATFQLHSLRLRQLAEKSCLKHMQQIAPARYHSALTPTYSFGCKRRVFDCDWLHSMHDARFTLSSGQLLAANVNGVKVVRKRDTASHEEEAFYPADTLILATGFEATQFLHPVNVTGRNGLSLHGLWSTRGGPHAYMGTAVDKFPNFFMIMGPNTFVGHTSVIMSIENSISYVLRMIKPVLEGDIETLEPTSEASTSWVRDIRNDMKQVVFEECHSWYNDNGAYNSVMYPRSQLDFYLRCQFSKLGDWDRVPTSRGRRRRLRWFLLKCATAGLLTCAGIFYNFAYKLNGEMSTSVSASGAIVRILEGMTRTALSGRRWVADVTP